MKWSISAIILCISAVKSNGFMSQTLSNHLNTGSSLGISLERNNVHVKKSTPLKMSTSGVDIETDHDVVTVDLADGRDYPIYIGAGFNDKEGNYIYNVLG